MPAHSFEPRRFSTYVELFRSHVERQSERTALTYLGDGENVTHELTYGQLDRRAREIAVWLRDRVPKSGRALLIFPPGLDFATSFLGCLYAGVTAVPAYPPRRRGNLDRLSRIASDAAASVVLTTSELIGEQTDPNGNTAFQDCPWCPVEEITGGAEGWAYPDISGSTLAFLQYTSGSTGTPKGVAVAHRNLMHNEWMIAEIFGQQPYETIMAGWLPMYHDMGLVGNLLHPLMMGGRLVFMSPLSFLQKPIRWLRMVSNFRATISGGPNFAFDLCATRTTAAEREGLDLSRWEVAFCGAEPIRYETLHAFESVFSNYGLRSTAIAPCFGMAETTLIVSGSYCGQRYITKTVDAQALRANRVVSIDATDQQAMRLVSSGRTTSEFDVRIVDPETLCEMAHDQIGEIWVSSDSVATGYWQRPEVTQETFQARLVNGDPSRQYLRTGDLGFLSDGELYVAGRVKDLIIINGANYYPQDLERTVETSHPDLMPGSGVAFSCDVDGAEKVFVAQEVTRGAWRTLISPRSWLRLIKRCLTSIKSLWMD